MSRVRMMFLQVHGMEEVASYRKDHKFWKRSEIPYESHVMYVYLDPKMITTDFFYHLTEQTNKQ